MVLECPCGEFHDIPQAGMVLIIRSFVAGEIQTIGKEKGIGPTQIRPMCVLAAFTDENIADIQKKYPKRQII